jgi:hypothetical protein
MRFFAMSGPQLGNPTADLETDVEALDKFTTEQGLDIDIYGAVVFLNDRIEIEAEDPAYPALRADLLVPFVNAIEPDASFPNQEREALIAALAEQAGSQVEVAKPTRRPVKVKRRAA